MDVSRSAIEQARSVDQISLLCNRALRARARRDPHRQAEGRTQRNFLCRPNAGFGQKLYLEALHKRCEHDRCLVQSKPRTDASAGSRPERSAPPAVGSTRHFRSLAFFLNLQGQDARQDLLTLLLRALDPSTGRPISVTEVRSNILTFLSTVHETTANTLAWSMFLLSQSPDWCARVREEAARELEADRRDLLERLVVTEEALRL